MKENFIIFSDVKQLFIRNKWFIIVGSALFGALGFYYRSQIPVTYEILATFKEAHSVSGSPGEGLFETMIKSIGIGEDQKGYCIITSSSMLIPVVEKMGLQANIPGENGWKKRVKRFKDTIDAEQRKPTTPEERFVFENVHYREETVKKYTLFFLSKNTFEVRTSKNRVLTTGHVGESVQFDGVTLTLQKVPSALNVRQDYVLTLSPLHDEVLALRERITVEAVQGERSLISLTLQDSDREFGKTILNTLMLAYKDYIQLDNKRVAQEQIAYLEKRREEFCHQMDHFLEEHVDYLKKSLGETGFLSLGQRLPLIQEHKKGLNEQLLDLDKEEERFFVATSGSTFPFDHEIAGLQREMHGLMKERDERGLALMESTPPANFIARLDALNLEELRIKSGVDQFLGQLISGLHQNSYERDKILVHLGDFSEVLSPDAYQLTKIQKEKKHLVTLLKEKEGIEVTASYLRNQIRLLSIQEEILKQRVFRRSALAEEFLGIDIQTLKKVLLSALQERDSSLDKVRKMEFVKKQMHEEPVEWVSFSAALPDTLSREMALEIGKLTQQMRKKGSFTEKELERMERSALQKKGDLLKHMDQTIHLERLQTDLINKRMRLVQTALLDLINKDIAVLQQQIKDRISERLTHIKKEKELVRGQMDQIAEEMGKIPEMWLKERQLQFSSEMHKGMLESIVRLVESKNIENNLVTIESKPLDFAYSSIIPNHPKLKIITLLGMMVGMVLTFGCFFFRAFYQGIPLSLENLKVRGCKVLGKLSKKISLEHFDLEVLRRLSLLLKEKDQAPLVVTLVLGKGEDYSSLLAELLHKEGRKTLLVDLDFSQKREQRNLSGLLPFLEGKIQEPTVISKAYGAYLPLGGTSLFGDELLKSKTFSDFIAKTKLHYDVVLLALPQKAKDSLPKSFFSCSDVMIVKLAEENYEELLPYFQWHDDKGTVAFVSHA